MLEREKDETHTLEREKDETHTNEVLVIGLHMVGRFEYGIVLQSNLEN